MMKRHQAVVLLLFTLLLGGCASNTLYRWDNYQDVVYQYYRLETGTAEQIGTLEADIEKARAKGKPVPPGLHAHLGLLYYQVGQADRALGQFQKEKELFPEGTRFMDFLIERGTGSIKKKEEGK